MTIEQIKMGLNTTVFSMGYAEDINADMYSVYMGSHIYKKDVGTWAIYILVRGTGVAQPANIGTFTGLTLQQYMEVK